VIAAGINLFGGPLGILHRHVTGAIPIRRNTKDPAYLVTLKAYVGEVLRRHDLFFYLEGGRSYTGELKMPKTGLIHATMAAEIEHLAIIPVAIAYDLVLEDRILSRQGVKRTQRPFSRELAEMVGAAVGYRTRAFVSFGQPMSLDGLDPHSRREGLELSRAIRERIGLLHKVLPTALVAQAMRPSATRREMETRVAGLLEVLASRGANLGAVDSVKQAVEQGIELLILRSVIVPESQRYRVRDRTLLRYYARSIEHLLSASRQSGARPH
jgi:glycerol-3-phosphate O-acyltransferase